MFKALLVLCLFPWNGWANEEASKRKIVEEFHRKAKQALKLKHYSEAIAAAETMRTIRLKKDQKHLNQAKQIIDRAKTARKEEFDSFIVEAKERFDQGDYQSSHDLCSEMLKKDPFYGVAKDCVAQSEAKLRQPASTQTTPHTRKK